MFTFRCRRNRAIGAHIHGANTKLRHPHPTPLPPPHLQSSDARWRSILRSPLTTPLPTDKPTRVFFVGPTNPSLKTFQSSSCLYHFGPNPFPFRWASPRDSPNIPSPCSAPNIPRWHPRGTSSFYPTFSCVILFPVTRIAERWIVMVISVFLGCSDRTVGKNGRRARSWRRGWDT